MGRTIPTIRQALTDEIAEWKPMRDWLRKGDREAFDEMINLVMLNASELSTAVRPIPFDYLVMGILFEQYKMLKRLGAKFPTEWNDSLDNHNGK